MSKRITRKDLRSMIMNEVRNISKHTVNEEADGLYPRNPYPDPKELLKRFKENPSVAEEVVDKYNDMYLKMAKNYGDLFDMLYSTSDTAGKAHMIYIGLTNEVKHQGGKERKAAVEDILKIAQFT